MDDRGEQIFSATYECFADGSTKMRQLICSDDNFWDVRKMMISMRNQIDQDVRSGPITCPFSPHNKKIEDQCPTP